MGQPTLRPTPAPSRSMSDDTIVEYFNIGFEYFDINCKGEPGNDCLKLEHFVNFTYMFTCDAFYLEYSVCVKKGCNLIVLKEDMGYTTNHYGLLTSTMEGSDEYSMSFSTFKDSACTIPFIGVGDNAFLADTYTTEMCGIGSCCEGSQTDDLTGHRQDNLYLYKFSIVSSCPTGTIVITATAPTVAPTPTPAPSRGMSDDNITVVEFFEIGYDYREQNCKGEPGNVHL